MKGKLIVVATIAVLAVAGHAALGQVTGKVATKSSPSMKAGAVFQECRNCPPMVVLPAGSFMMGTPETEANRRDHEHLHEVTIARPFAVSQTEVTWDQWEACVRDGMCDGVAVETALRTPATPAPRRKECSRRSPHPARGCGREGRG